MSDDPHIRGELPDYVVKSLTLDETGLYAGIIQRHFPVGPVNQRISLAWLSPRQAPNPGWGIPCTGASAEILNNGLCAVTYAYKGVDPGGNDSFDSEKTVFEFDGSMNEDKIETHPAFKEIKRIYGWDETERKFPEAMPGTDSSKGLSGSDVKKGDENPMFGTDSWLVIAAVYRMTYCAKSIPSNILEGIGTIIKAPPNVGQFKVPNDGKRNWLVLSPKISKQGNAVRITLEWALSGPKGWLTPVYSKAQLSNF